MGLFGWLGNLLTGGGNKRVQNQIKNGYGMVNSRNDSLYNYINGQLPGQQAKSDALYGDIQSGFNKFTDPTKLPGYDTFSEFSKTGGVDPRLRSQLEGSFGRADSLADWGAGMANTGGFTNQDKANFRARGTSNVPSFFSSLKDTLASQNAAQGGYNPGYTAQTAKLARDQAHASQKAVFDTEAELTDQINRNKFQGAGVEGNAINAGMQGRQSLLDAIMRGREFGASGLQDATKTSMGALQGLQGLYESSPGMLKYLMSALQGNIGESGQLNEDQIANLMRDRNFQGGLISSILSGGLGMINPLSKLFGGGSGIMHMTNTHPTNLSSYGF